MYRRLLTTLSEAYQVDAIVAVPVAVTAPPDWCGDTAPRLHGQPVGTVFGVPAERRPSWRATPWRRSRRTGSTVWAVGTANAEVVGLIAAGIGLTLPTGQAYVIAPGDTLAEHRRHPRPAAGHRRRRGRRRPGLLVPGVAVTVPTSTLRTLAGAFAAPLPLLIDVLADATGILLPGAVVSGPWTYSSPRATRSPRLATRFGRTVPELGAALGTVPGLLAPGVADPAVERGQLHDASRRHARRDRGRPRRHGREPGRRRRPGSGPARARRPDRPPALHGGHRGHPDRRRRALPGHGRRPRRGARRLPRRARAGCRRQPRRPYVHRGRQDTLFSVLDYLALDVATPESLAAAVTNLAAMNADVPGLLAPGCVLTVPDPVVLTDGDSIAGLAAAHQQTALEVATVDRRPHRRAAPARPDRGVRPDRPRRRRRGS